MEVKADSRMNASWKTGGHDIGYDGCGAHTHKGIWRCPEESNLQIMLNNLREESESFLANTLVEVKASFLESHLGNDNPLYYIQVRSGNKAIYRVLVGDNVREAVDQAAEILEKIKEQAKEFSVTMLQSEVEYNPLWLENS